MNEKYKQQVLKVVAELQTLRDRGISGERHREVYVRLKGLAVRNYLEFARMIANGEVAHEFYGLLAIQGGSAHPLLPGCLAILYNGTNKEARQYATWAYQFHNKAEQKACMTGVVKVDTRESETNRPDTDSNP